MTLDMLFIIIGLLLNVIAETKYNSIVPATKMSYTRTRKATKTKSYRTATNITPFVTRSTISTSWSTSVATESKAQVATSVYSSTVDRNVLLAAFGSSAGLLVISVFFNVYFIQKRRRTQIEYTNEGTYSDLMPPEHERGRHHTIPTAINTDIRNIPCCNDTASYKSPAVDMDEYLSPRQSGEKATYDYVQ
ncbi:hypothetical protein CHS0354_012394 [Potamilus streckersoni]|uniref:Uncharacterized protein n=1 Tax=Potamilus streckersoni TaxID=2493646 RepID=A0AAE0VKX5_9BIVA|nr:hypothetical protein CHS0354_012394 [Potamilus streckersoni]